MGKKTFAMLIVAVVALFAGYNMYQSQSNVVALSELALANVEALAGDEIGSNNCYATICYNKCRAYIYESTKPCTCGLCSGK